MISRAKGRKGLVYTTIAMLVFSILVLVATTQSFYLNAGERQAISKISSDTMRSFVSTVERDYDKALDVSARRAVVASVNYVSGGTSLSNAEEALEELIMNGTLYGLPSALMENSTVSYWLSKMSEKGGNAGLSVSMEFSNFSVEENSAFSLLVQTTISLNVSSLATESAVSRTILKNFTVQIENFTDPYYSVRNLGLVTRIIRKSPYISYQAFLANGTNATGSDVRGLARHASTGSEASGFANKSGTILVMANGSVVNSTVASQFAGIVSESSQAVLSTAYVIGASNARDLIPNGTYVSIDSQSKSVWNRSALDSLEETISEGYYLEGYGPSFLDRLELKDNLTRSFGLESIASLPEISDKGIPVYTNTTTVDYLYFQNGSVSGKSVRGIYYSWFKVDSVHEAFYGITAPNGKTLAN